MVLLNLYGSLRKGEYNHNAFVRQFGEENFVYKETKVLDGFELYSLGAYPMVVHTPENPENRLVVDVFEVSQSCYSSIKGMELGAGYDELVLDDGAIIYTQRDSKGLKRVESGDWSEYLRSKREQSSLESIV